MEVNYSFNKPLLKADCVPGTLLDCLPPSITQIPDIGISLMVIFSRNVGKLIWRLHSITSS